MSKAWLIGVVMACATLGIPVLAQDTREYVMVEIKQVDGKLRGGYQARDEKPEDLERTSSVNMQFLQRRDAKDEKGRIVSGIGVVAWLEGDGVRVWPFSIVPREGVPNAVYASPQGIVNTRREPLGESVLKVGETRRLTEMQQWGVEPFVLEVVRITR